MPPALPKRTMGMREGYWINYRVGRVELIDEHPLWVRRPGHAARLEGEAPAEPWPRPPGALPMEGEAPAVKQELAGCRAPVDARAAVRCFALT
jgi:hypothetical protein